MSHMMVYVVGVDPPKFTVCLTEVCLRFDLITGLYLETLVTNSLPKLAMYRGLAS
jgi:hypothetical protein